MTRRLTFPFAIAALAVGVGLQAQQQTLQPPPTPQVTDKQVAQERATAEREAPKIAEVLELKPGMTVADIGAGGGAMTIVLGKWIGSGHVFATDIVTKTLETIRAYVKREGLTNVTVLEGAAAATNLPAACCDAIFMRNVYHHITDPDAFDKSLVASLKPGGRLAIIDFRPTKGSAVPEGVRANREGHGVPTAVVVSELTATGMTHEKTFETWLPDAKTSAAFLVLFKKS